MVIMEISIECPFILSKHTLLTLVVLLDPLLTIPGLFLSTFQNDSSLGAIDKVLDHLHVGFLDTILVQIHFKCHKLHVSHSWTVFVGYKTISSGPKAFHRPKPLRVCTVSSLRLNCFA